MKILYLYKEDWEEEYMKERLAGEEIHFFKSFEEVPEEILNNTEVLCVFVSHQSKKEEIDKLPNLKLIAARSTGFDYIDIPYARSKGAEVVNVPSYGEHTVAEFAFAILLALSRKIPQAHEQVTEKGSFAQLDLRGFDLIGKTLGVVGTGRIGTNFIKIAKGFDMRVIAYDPFPKQDLDQELGFQYLGFEDVLRQSDVLSLHAPLNEHTRHMLNNDNINLLKKGVLLINTARGGLVETVALERALKEDIIAGAGLDVLEEEKDMSDETCLLSDSQPKIEELKNVLANYHLMHNPKVIITPHIAFNTEEAVKRILDTTIENIKTFASGETKNRVP